MNQSPTNFPSQIPENWWSKPSTALLEKMAVDPEKGLPEDRVSQSRERFGANRMADHGPTSLWKLLWESLTSPMMLVLLAIAGISLALGQTREAIVMAVVVAIYVGVHLLNKARSDRTMAKLRQVQAPKTVVLRGGEQHEIGFEDVVVGDVQPLRAGSRLPADGRLITSAGLLVDEGTLTGESAPVRKDANAEIPADTPLAERKTAVFAGTTVLDGQGKAVVMAVGDTTELGQISALATQGDSEPTPLQQEMDDLATTLAYVAVGVSLLIPLVGVLLGFDFQQMVLTWLSLTFLMVPGQPPIIIAMALALASLELARKGVIVRRLQGAETLGSVTLALSDKTGTMTENEMRVEQVLYPNGELVKLDDDQSSQELQTRQFLENALLAIPETTNNPTDLAMLQAGKDIQPKVPGELINLRGFSQGGSYRSMTYREGDRESHYLTGRPEILLAHSSRWADFEQGGFEIDDFNHGSRSQVKAKINEQAQEGKRIAAYAYYDREILEALPDDLVFLGVAILEDPVRSDVPGAIQDLEVAGVRTVMVTGDIPETAISVAERVGLDPQHILTGDEIDQAIDDHSLLKETSVFARSTPKQKYDLVKAYQGQGEAVAVTGDGINDAPALKAAHIGVAMGEKCTDVAREAADLVLTDDNFAHLPQGVAIGRKAYDNFRKGITYYLSAKAILLTIFILPLAFGLPFPLAPIQIIFTELLMDLASSTIFITEDAEPNIMDRQPRRRKKFLSWAVGKAILRNMAGLTIAILVVYFLSLGLDMGLASARTAAFATWLLGHIMLAMNLKQEKTPLFKQGLFSNTFAVGWLLGMIAFVLAMTLWPFAQSVLGTTSLSGLQWVMVVTGSLFASMWMEALKWVRSSK